MLNWDERDMSDIIKAGMRKTLPVFFDLTFSQILCHSAKSVVSSYHYLTPTDLQATWGMTLFP